MPVALGLCHCHTKSHVMSLTAVTSMSLAASCKKSKLFSELFLSYPELFWTCHGSELSRNEYFPINKQESLRVVNKQDMFFSKKKYDASQQVNMM